MIYQNQLIGLGLICVLCLCSAQLSAVMVHDQERERLIAERLQERVKVGTPMWLGSSDRQFLGILTEQMTTEEQGLVIILHGMGAHPDWPIVVSDLRKTLPQQGWTSLAIQLPILSPSSVIEDYGKTLDEAMQRIDVAVQYARENGHEKIVFLGYSFGGATLAKYLAGNNQEADDILGMAGISMLAQPFLSPSLDLLTELEKIKIPVIDIYGSRDFDRIVDAAADRRLAARKAKNPWYEQIEIDGADHAYSGLNTVLERRIRGWLDKLIADYQLRKDNEAEEDANSMQETP